MDQNSSKSNGVSIEALSLIKEEEEILSSVISSLISQRDSKTALKHSEGSRARELTAELVATNRAEDKALLASDEAVAHALSQKHVSDEKQLDRIIKKPYFARFVLAEEAPNGQIKHFEYRMGFIANADCRIIDWRKSPLAKIFYEYQEGDEYCEEVQGVEREGTVILRNTYLIEKGILKQVTCKYGTFTKAFDGSWQQSTSHRLSGGIKDVLPLITPEQFKLITEKARTAILIQGVAGSGKTTVALHRLAWLIDTSNSDINPEECAVIVRSDTLASYIRLTLAALHIEDVPVYTYQKWSEKLLRTSNIKIAEIHELSISEPRGLLMLRYSEEYFKLLETNIKTLKNDPSRENKDDHAYQLFSLLVSVIDDLNKYHPQLVERLGIKTEEVYHYYSQLKEKQLNQSNITLPQSELPTAIRYVQELGNLPLNPPKVFSHLVVDELQDYSMLGLASLISAVKETKDLTLVGDTAQSLQAEYNFIGWQKLKSVWKFEEGEDANFFSLQVSHRSTIEIMQLAANIAGQAQPTAGRHGRKPIWFHCRNEQDCLEKSIKWLGTAAEKYPDHLTAVLCRDLDEAKQIYSMLQPTFGPTIRLGKSYDFSFEEGIVVTIIDDVKGLEFTNVLLWNPSREKFPKHDPLSKNRLYVAITRAADNLAIVTHNRYSELLPSTHSALVRGYDYRDEVEE